jgi:hypothetical protein
MEVVLKAFPSIVVPMEFLQTFSADQIAAFLEKAFAQLPERQQTAIMALDASIGKGHGHVKIMNTNDYWIKIDQAPYRALIPYSSVGGRFGRGMIRKSCTDQRTENQP